MITLITIVSLIAIVGALIYESHLYFIKRPKNLIINEIKSWNVRLIFAIIYILLGLVLFTISIKNMEAGYRLIRTEYYQSIFVLIDYTTLNTLREQFAQEGELIKLLNIIQYTNGLWRLYFGLLQILIGIIWFLRGSCNFIGEDGLYQNGRYNWNRVRDFSWGETGKRKYFSKVIEFSELSFTIDSSRMIDKLGIKENKITFRIPLNDKEKLNSFLQEKVKKK